MTTARSVSTVQNQSKATSQLFRQYETHSFGIFKDKFAFMFTLMMKSCLTLEVLCAKSSGFALDLPVISYDNSLAAIYYLLISF